MSFRGMSRWPWMRASTFQAVSPWRMAMMRVACMRGWRGVLQKEQALSRKPGKPASRATVETGTAQLRDAEQEDRKSTRLNSSHSQISYAVFCLKKKKKDN